MKRSIIYRLLLLVVFLAHPAASSAEKIVLKSNQTIEGAITDIGSDYLEVNAGGKFSTIAFVDIESIDGVPIDEDADLSEEDCGLVKPLSDGIYEMEGVKIKLLAPPGWKMSKGTRKPEDTLCFMPSCMELTNLTVSVSPASPVVKIESAKEEFEKDPSCLSTEIISFAGSKALKTIIMVAGMKTQQVMLVKDGRLFILTYVVLSDDDFDKYLPDIKLSLGSFKVLS